MFPPCLSCPVLARPLPGGVLMEDIPEVKNGWGVPAPCSSLLPSHPMLLGGCGDFPPTRKVKGRAFLRLSQEASQRGFWPWVTRGSGRGFVNSTCSLGR